MGDGLAPSKPATVLVMLSLHLRNRRTAWLLEAAMGACGPSHEGRRTTFAAQ
jgi:hypothetical protein